MNPMVSVSGLASGVQWQDLVDQIIAAESIRRVAPLTQRIDAGRKRADAWNQFKTFVTRLETASRKLRDGDPFRSLSATGGTSALSGRALVTATATQGAVPGGHAVEVLSLARSEKLAGSGVANSTTPLDEFQPPIPTGTFSLNGREITIEPGDSLARLRDRINAANKGPEASGVAASILTVSPGEHRLILTSTATGAAGIVLDDQDGVLTALGISGDSRSATVGSTSSPLATMLGLPAPPEVRTVVIQGREVTVDLATDSMQSLMAKIRDAASAAGADPEAAARIVEVDGAYRLEVAGSATGRSDDAATRAILGALGFSRDGLAAAGTDAAVRIDGIQIARATNTIGDAIPGLSLALHGAEPGTVLDVAVARDADAAVDAVTEFAAAYNELVRFAQGQRGEGKPLAMNSTLRNAMSSLTGALLQATEGLESEFERGAQVGLTLSRSGRLELDESVLRSVVVSNPDDVRSLFGGRSGDDPVVGLAGRMYAGAQSLTRTSTGVIAIQLDTIDRSAASLSRRRDDAEARLDMRRETLTAQFVRMESALSMLNSQGAWLSSQLQALQPRRDR
jgi:flagellar hook-associated protein 2